MIDEPISISRPVYVEWIDSSTSHGWKEPKTDLDLRCWTFGFLVGECDETVTVASTVESGGQVLDQITIPRAAITLIQDVSWV